LWSVFGITDWAGRDQSEGAKLARGLNNTATAA
jgi:hypothetical protein